MWEYYISWVFVCFIVHLFNWKRKATFWLHIFYCLLHLLHFYWNASVFLLPCVVLLCTISTNNYGLFGLSSSSQGVSVPVLMSVCLKHTTTLGIVIDVTFFSSSLSRSFSLFLQEPFSHNENHNGCCLIKQALISGRLKPLQLAREKRAGKKSGTHSYAFMCHLTKEQDLWNQLLKCVQLWICVCAYM